MTKCGNSWNMRDCHECERGLEVFDVRWFEYIAHGIVAAISLHEELRIPHKPEIFSFNKQKPYKMFTAEDSSMQRETLLLKGTSTYYTIVQGHQ